MSGMCGHVGSIMIYLYADGASRGNPGPAAYGVHIEDMAGNTIADFGETIGIATNNQAEYSAVIAGLRYLTQTDYREVTVRMDSKLVVEQLSGRWKIKNSAMVELAIAARELVSKFDVAFQWIPREQNSAADANANRALDSGNFSSVPDSQLELASVQPRGIRAPRQSIEPTTIIVVRHGHTLNTERNVISGGDGTDPELSELGIWEAEGAAKALPQLLTYFGLPEIAAIHHSPMVRTTQTATAVARVVPAPLIADSRLREIGFGEWEMRQIVELETDSSVEIARWRGSMSARPPGGESVLDLQHRVWQALDEMIDAYRTKTVVVSTHMMPTRAFAAAAYESETAYWGLGTSPAGISMYRFFGRSMAEIFLQNYCAHLMRS